MRLWKTVHGRLRTIAVRVLGALLVIQLLLQGSDGFRSLAAARAGSNGAEVAVSAKAAEAAAEKLRQIREASSNRTAGSLTQFSEEEVNSYLALELASRYPSGISDVQVRFLPGRILGTSQVDFAKLKAAHRTSGGMADYLFWGIHTLSVEGGFSAIDGVGQFDLESVSLDGFTLPQRLVDLLIETFLKPRFPSLALNRPFRLPYSIDRVQVMRERIAVEVNPPVTD